MQWYEQVGVHRCCDTQQWVHEKEIPAVHQTIVATQYGTQHVATGELHCDTAIPKSNFRINRFHLEAQFWTSRLSEQQNGPLIVCTSQWKQNI